MIEVAFLGERGVLRGGRAGLLRAGHPSPAVPGLHRGLRRGGREEGRLLGGPHRELPGREHSREL